MTAPMPIYRRIVAVVDGSAAREQALPHAMALAQKYDASIALLMISPSPELFPARPMPLIAVGSAAYAPIMTPDLAESIEVQRQAVQAYLDLLVRRLRDIGLSVSCDECEDSTGETISTHALALKADLIVMTSYGRGGIRRLVLGSIADEVARHAHCPVLLVRVDETSQEV